MAIAHTAQHPLSGIKLNRFITTVLLSAAYAGVLIGGIADRTGHSSLYLLGLLQLTPLMLSIGRGRPDYLAFIGVSYFSSYTFSQINIMKDLGADAPVPEITLNAIHELIICSLLTAAVYYTVRLFIFSRSKKKEDFLLMKLTLPQLSVCAVFVLGYPFFYQHIPGALGSVSFTFLFASLMLIMTSDCPGHEFGLESVKIGSFLSLGILFLQSGALGGIATAGSIYLMVTVLQKRYRRLLFFVCFTIVMLSIQTVKSEFRNNIYADSETGNVDRILLLGQLLANKYFSDTVTLVTDSDTGEEEQKEIDNADVLASGLSRANDDSLERVLLLTPGKVPFWNGDSYASIPFMFIPRILWPAKPARDFWNRFGHDYNYLTEDDDVTSVSVSYIAEGFMNYGYTGMYGVALLMGLFVVLVERFSQAFLGGNFYFTFVAFLSPLLAYSTDFGTILNGVVINVGVMLVVRTQLVKMSRRDVYS